jgi:hypothetical protein
MYFLVRREDWVLECKGLETTNETKERTKARSGVKLRMTGDSVEKEREREGEERSEWKPGGRYGKRPLIRKKT